jgi:hypothetical protein
MLLQGMLLGGITMVVTARTIRDTFPSGIDCSVFDIMEWSRKCSVILNIMSERWGDTSVSDLEAKFTLLANDMIKRLMTPDAASLQQIPQEGASARRGGEILPASTAPSGWISADQSAVDAYGMQD